jgi:hypothetical protein
MLLFDGKASTINNDIWIINTCCYYFINSTIYLVPSIYAGIDDKDSKDLCEDNGGDWEDGQCDFKADDEDKADSYLNDMQKIEKFEEEKAALEDYLCEEPDAKFDICNPTGRDDKDDKVKVINKHNDDDNKKYGVKSKDGENEVTRYYDNKDDAEEAYENLDRDELTYSDKSYSDWEYDDEEHPSLR